MKKRLILILTAVVLVAAVLVGGTWAYRTETIETTNVINIGKVKVTARAENAPKDKIVPGVALPIRNVYIQNSGTTAAYVRVKLECTDQGLRDSFPMTVTSTPTHPWKEWVHPTTKETYHLYMRPIPVGGSITMAAVAIPSIAITSEDAARAAAADLLVTVEAVQSENFPLDSTGYPQWADTVAEPAP